MGGGGLGCHKFKSQGSCQTAGPIGTKCGRHRSVYPPGNGYTPNKLPLETKGGHLGGGGVRVKYSKVFGSCQTAGPIGINLCSRLPIHLGMNIS